jgi:MOSC domain-containing protein YiiM
MPDAVVVAIHLSTKSRAPLKAVSRVVALADRGLEGDRHARPGRGRQVLVIEQEVLDQFALHPGDVREQITVRGIDVAGLPDGARLRVGDAVFGVEEPCEPCRRMEELRPGLQRALVGRRGRFVRVLEGGSVAVGNSIAVLPQD